MRPYLLAVPLLLFVYLYGLSNAGLIGPDEPRYAAVGREMARSGDYVTPRLWGEPWFEKPPLLYWLVASGYQAGLTGESAIRVPVALVGAGFIIFFFLRMRREFGEVAAGYAGAVLATTAGWLVYSHVAVTDIVLSAAFCSAILMCLPWVRSGGRRGLVVAGVLLGFAILAKGLVPVVLVLPILWAGRRNWRDLSAFLFAATVVAAPWYVLCYLRNGQVFVDEFVYKHHIGRFLSSDLQHVQPFYFYVPVLIGLLFPWSAFLGLLFRRSDYSDERVKLLAWTIALGFVFFSLSTNKLPGYLLPLIPLLAALIGLRLARSAPPRLPFWIVALSLFVIPVLAGVLPHLLLGSEEPFRWSVAFEPVPTITVLLTVAVILWLISARADRTALGLIALSVFGCVLLLKAFTFPEIDRIATARPMWAEIVSGGTALPCSQSVPRELRYGLMFYADKHLPDCSGDAGKP